MKKTEGAEPGWYDDPENNNKERFWNGKYWEKQTRQIGEIVETQLAINEFALGPFLFRLPVKRDKVFIVYIVICVFSLISGISQELQLGTRGSLIPVMYLLVIPMVIGYVYLLFLPYLLFRRRRDKKRLPETEINNVTSYPRRKSVVVVSTVLLLLLSSPLIIGLFTQNNSRVDVFLESQQAVSEVLGEYNAAAGTAVGVVRNTSDGNLSAGDAIAEFAAANAKVLPILTKLRQTCEEISYPSVEGTGEDLAIAKAFNMLKVGCEVTPKMYFTLIEIHKEQVAESGTQSRLNQLSAELSALGRQKTNAALEGLEAVLPYADESQASMLKKLREGILNQ